MSKQYTQSIFQLYRNPAVPINGTTPSVPWQFPGAALTASSIPIAADFPMKVASALWFLVWTPEAGATYNAVRLVKADDGPTNLVQIAFINRNNATAPKVDVVNIKNELQAIYSGGVRKQILQQTCGDTSSKIYGSWIEVVFEIDPAI